MKRIFLLLIIIIVSFSSAKALIFSVVELDSTQYPLMKAKFYAFDNNYKLRTNLTISDIEVEEFCQKKPITSFSCQAPKDPDSLSVVMTIDRSMSMCMNSVGLAFAQNGFYTLINTLDFSRSECALTSFNCQNYLDLDFSHDRNNIITYSNMITCQDPHTIDTPFVWYNTNYDSAFLNLPGGAIDIAKNGGHKRVVILITDGGAITYNTIIDTINNDTIINGKLIKRTTYDTVLVDSTILIPQTNEIIKKAKDNNITIYSITLGKSSLDFIKEISDSTGGFACDNILTYDDMNDVILKILMKAQGIDPCEIQWYSDTVCTATNVYLKIKNLYDTLEVIKYYDVPNKDIAKLEISPTSVFFWDTPIGGKADTTIWIKAIYANFNVSDISTDNSSLSISPKSFYLKCGDSIKINISHFGTDSIYKYSKLNIISDLCPRYYYVHLIYHLSNKIDPTITVIKPNGNERYMTGSDVEITWKGGFASDSVKIEYSIDSGNTWITIIDNVTGYSYLWKNIPNTPSNQCLVRVTKLKTHSYPDFYLVNKILPIDTTEYIEYGGNLYAANWCPDGKKIVTASFNHDAFICDAFSSSTFKLIGDTIYGDHSDSALIYSASWSPEGKRILTSGESKIPKIWDADDHTPTFALFGHEGLVYYSYWNHDGTKVISEGSDDKMIKVWDAGSGDSLITMIGHTDGIYNIDCNPIDNRIASASNDRTVKVWNGDNGKLLSTINVGYPAYNAIWNSKGNKLAIVSDDGNIRIWDAVKDSVINIIYGHKGYNYDIAWSHNGKYIASFTRDALTAMDTTARMIDAETGQLIFSFFADSSATNGTGCSRDLAWSFDDSFLATSVWDNTVRIWDTHTGKLSGSLSHGGLVNKVAWSPDGSFLSCAGDDGFAYIWFITEYLPSDVSDTLFSIVLPDIVEVNKIIDFGSVPIYFYNDSLQAVTVTNNSSNDIILDSITFSNNNLNEFSSLSNLKNITIKPKDTLRLDLRFSPVEFGKQSCYLNFNYNSKSSPAKIQLIGNVSNDEYVKIDNDSAKPGDIINLKLRLQKNYQPHPQKVIAGYKAVIGYNSTILTMLDGRASKSYTLTNEIAQVNGSWDGSSDIIDEFTVGVGLGNCDTTGLFLSQFNWLDSNNNIITTAVNKKDGKFVLLGLCREGGTRLINPNLKADFVLVAPNPVKDNFEIQYNLIENGFTTIYLTNLLGEYIKTIYSGEGKIGSNKIMINAENIPSGLYNLILHTPTIIKSENVSIIK